MDFQRALDAGLTQSELANILGISRVTMNLWVHGKMKPHRYNADHIHRRMALVGVAIDRNMLPGTMGRRTPRHEALANLMRSLEASENATPA